MAEANVRVDLSDITRELNGDDKFVRVPANSTVEDVLHEVDEIVELALEPINYALWTQFPLGTLRMIFAV